MTRKLVKAVSRFFCGSKRELILLLAGTLAIFLNLRYVDIRALYTLRTGQPLPVEHVNLFDYAPTLLGFLMILGAAWSLLKKLTAKPCD